MEKYRPSIFDVLFKTERRRLRIVNILWYVCMVSIVAILFLSYLVVTN
jgi:hypothetical protein